MDFDAAIDDLYGLLPGEFTAARNARVAEAKREADAGLVAALRTLPKPVASAWLANQFARRRPELLEGLLGLGEAMRAAQRDLDGTQMRALGRRRTDLVRALSQEARALAEELGNPVGDAAVGEFEGTLQAALADERAASAFATGRLVRALEVAGLGEVDLDGALAGGASSGASSATRRGGARGAERGTVRAARDDGLVEDTEEAGRAERLRRRAEAEEEARRAEERLDRSEAEAAAVDEALRSVTDKRRQLRDRIAELETELARLEEEDSALGGRLAGLDRDRRAAQRTIEDDRRTLALARSALDDLPRPAP